jgi:carboxypeptidase Q
MRQYIFKLSAAAALAAIAQQSNAIPPPPPPTASQLAADDNIAYSIVEDLTKQIGQRQGGTQAEQRARDWAVARLNAMGFANVREEAFMMPTWVRGEERMEIISPSFLTIKLTALGNSASTGAQPLTGEIAFFGSFDEFVAAPDHYSKGKIVFINHQMTRTQDGSSYGYFGRARFQGPNLAAKKGAIAFLVRSIGTGDHNDPHTGNTNFDAGVAPIPAAAISPADTDKFIAAYWNAGKTADPSKKCDAYFGCPNVVMKVRLTLTPEQLGPQKSGNVIAEALGSNPSLPAILVACHLDSWDLATGAIDDASGCGIVTAAAYYAQKAGGTRRTIRILWAGAEEVGIWGGKDYALKHGNEPHALAMESDFGADRVWAADFNLPDSAKILQTRISQKLGLLGIVPRTDKARGGADIGAIIAAQGLGIIDLQQDGTRYFDLHHNAGDTLDKIDRAQLRQNVIAWATVLQEVANYEGELKPEPIGVIAIGAKP